MDAHEASYNRGFDRGYEHAGQGFQPRVNLDGTHSSDPWSEGYAAGYFAREQKSEQNP